MGKKAEVIEHIPDSIIKCLKKHPNAELVIHGDFNDLDKSTISQTFDLQLIVTFPTWEMLRMISFSPMSMKPDSHCKQRPLAS